MEGTIKSNIRRYFASGNTAKGFYSLFDSVLAGLDHLYILKGGPGGGKSTLMKTIGTELCARGFSMEFVHCAADKESLDAVIISDYGIGIVDGTAPHVIEPKLPGAVEQYVNLGVAWDVQQLKEKKQTIAALNEQIKDRYTEAYDTFAAALAIHDELEQIYIAALDVTKLNDIATRLVNDIFSHEQLPKRARPRHMFLGAATPQGAADHIPSITAGLDKRYFLKGRAGCGKSSLLKKIAAAASARGFDAEIYHCGFDPDSLDMVLLPELSVAVFDSTAPHEYFPDRASDEVIDLYALAVTPGTDEANADHIRDTHARYKNKMKAGIAHLAETKVLRDELEAIYVAATDFSLIEQMTRDIAHEIDDLMAHST